ncbi:MAG TPA: hypothetical protein VJM11_06985 [Nevskiaceae bacterium]|nr:hypothetical protein [Nevskiaceae bacterium]
MAYVSNYPQAPFDAVMPAGPQEIVLGIAAVALAGFVLLALAMCVKHRTALPLLFLVAGFCTVLLEPMVTHVGHAIHPEIGQIQLFKTHDRAIPWHIATIYAFYFGGVFMFMFSRIREGRFTRDFVWKSYFFTCALAYLIEIVPVHVGLWVYYEPQALWVWKGGMPLFWTFVNAGCIYMALTLIKLFYPVLRGWKEILVVPIAGMGAIMGHFGAGYLYYNAANSAAPQWLVEAAGLGSVGLALTITWFCSRLLAANTAAIFSVEAAAPARAGAPAGAATRAA